MELPTLKKVDPNKPKKPKILLLSDDLRLHSGIATQSKEIVLSTIHKYDWVQLGAALKHPDAGKVFDVSVDTQKESGVDDASLKIYASDGYGNPDVLRQLINIEKPDAILHFTDPRFWKWLYDMEHEVREFIPIMYYNIWDSLPDPMWNAPFYASCDLLISISKQTYGINKRTLEKYEMPKEDWAYKYIPHGVSKHFRPISSNDTKLSEFKERHGLNEYDFVVLWNNRNIRRKVPGDVILAFNEFAKKHEDKKVCLFLHTQRSDENGTDLVEVIKHNGHHGDYKFTDLKFSTEDLNLYYNSGDIILNIASNEGFGLASCEALRALGHGNWVYPVWPSNRSLQGSPMTPYIFDDRCDFIEVADQLGNALRDGRDHLEAVGNYGSEWVQGESGMASETMGDKFIDAIDGCLENWTPRKRFEIYSV